VNEDDWTQLQESDRRETETFRRIHRLVKRGYRVDWSVTDVEDALWLNHPGRGPGLIMYPGGLIVSLDKSIIMDPGKEFDQDKIGNQTLEDTRLFDHWLATVALPSWRERTAADREKYIWKPGCLLLFLLMSLAIGKFLEMIWKSVVGP
jgi:hypothetical protein